MRGGPVAQRIRHLTTNQGIAGSSPARVKFLLPKNDFCWKTKIAPPGGLEPPTFRLTAERASRLRHGGSDDKRLFQLLFKIEVCFACIFKERVKAKMYLKLKYVSKSH